MVQQVWHISYQTSQGIELKLDGCIHYETLQIGITFDQASVNSCSSLASDRASIFRIQSTPVISRQLGAKIREHELSGSPVIAKAQTRNFQDQSPTLWRLHLLNPNSMLSDNGYTYILRISADVDIAPATNHNKPCYILIIMHQKLSNYTLFKAAYDGICAETTQTTMRFDRKRK